MLDQYVIFKRTVLLNRNSGICFNFFLRTNPFCDTDSFPYPSSASRILWFIKAWLRPLVVHHQPSEIPSWNDTSPHWVKVFVYEDNKISNEEWVVCEVGWMWAWIWMFGCGRRWRDSGRMEDGTTGKVSPGRKNLGFIQRSFMGILILTNSIEIQEKWRIKWSFRQRTRIRREDSITVWLFVYVFLVWKIVAATNPNKKIIYWDEQCLSKEEQWGEMRKCLNSDPSADLDSPVCPWQFWNSWDDQRGSVPLCGDHDQAVRCAS